MKLSMEKSSLADYVCRQLKIFLPDGNEINQDILEASMSKVLERCENCFQHILVPGYRDMQGAVFSHLHMDQYASFLYFLGNTIWERYHEKMLCDKLLNLNRILNGFFISYKCSMPKVFIFAHPVGSVIGNAIYGEGLYVSQNVTINTHMDANGIIDLKIGKGCFLGAGAKIIGNKPIGNRVSIGVDALVYDQCISDDSVCLKDEKGQLLIRRRQKKECMAQSVFDLDLY